MFTRLGRLIPAVMGKAASSADAWEAAVIAAGGTVSAGTKGAVADFLDDLSIAGLTAKIIRLNLFAGDQLAAALVPQIATVGDALDTNVNFVAGDFAETTGLDPGASNSTKCLRTGIIPTTTAGFATGASMGFWESGRRGNFVVWSGFMGVGDVAGAGTEQRFFVFEIPPAYYRNYTAYGASVQSTDTFGYESGFHAASRLVAGSRRIYFNGSAIATDAGADADDTRSDNELRVFAMVHNGYTTWCEQVSYGYFIGYDLLNDDHMNLYNAWATFNTAMGRA